MPSPYVRLQRRRGATAAAVASAACLAGGIPAAAVRAASLPASPSVPAVTATDTGRRVVLANGRVALTIRKDNAQIVSFQRLGGSDGRGEAQPVELGNGKVALYFDANAGQDAPPAGAVDPKKGYHRVDGTITGCEVLHSSPDRAEIVFHAAPAPFFPFQVDIHYVLFRGESGYYAYVVYHHGPGMPAGTLWQTRFVVKAHVPDVFDHYVVDPGHIVPVPTGAVTQKLADVTYRLSDGSVKTKYMQSVYWGDHLAYGDTGPGIGLWMITPSPEFFNGGPVKQGQTVHDDNILRVMQSVHFGASPLHFTDGETWEKVYGPVFVYVNSGPNPEAMLGDAELRQTAEAARWPYAWVTDPAYHRARGVVTGRIHLADGASTYGAWVILSPPGEDWTAQGKGYEFWTGAGADGGFRLPKVIPGAYTLYAVGADQPEQFVKQNVTVTAGATTALGDLTWQPVRHGAKIWQIGTFDRTAAEFRNGSDAHQFEMFARYPSQFPNDVVYTVGQSDPARDWNYAQWTWYSKKPYWTIRFRLNEAPKGNTATLTLGFASAQPMHGGHTQLLVKANGTQIGDVQLPKTGTAGYRGGAQDSKYNVRYLTFPAHLLHAGWNEITLGHRDAVPFPAGGVPDVGPTGQRLGQVMYDALRLEVQQP